jgi:hypothetical protein
MTEHLGYGKHDRAGVGRANIRNGIPPGPVSDRPCAFAARSSPAATMLSRSYPAAGPALIDGMQHLRKRLDGYWHVSVVPLTVVDLIGELEEERCPVAVLRRSRLSGGRRAGNSASIQSTMSGIASSLPPASAPAATS